MRKNDNRYKLKAAAIALAFAGFPLLATAAGLGRLTVHSALGQALKAEIELSATKEEAGSLTARVAPIEQFQQQGIDYSPSLATLRFSVDHHSGRPILRVSSTQPVNEPFLDMLVELNWSSGRLVREYTFLLDPAGHLRPVAAIHTPPVVDAPKADVPPAAAQAKPAEAKPAEAPKPEVKPELKHELHAAPAKTETAATEKAKPAKTAAAKTTRKVKSGDTLGKIANETKPDGVSLEQMLVALFTNNQDAFAGNNMNRLKAGKILAVPEKETVDTITPNQAKKTIATQAENFNAYRRKLAALSAQKSASKEGKNEQRSTGKITPKVEDKTPTASASKDRLEVSRTEAGKAAEAERLAKKKSVEEAQARAAAMEKRNAELQKQNEAAAKLAEAQKQAQAKTDAGKPADPAKPADAAKLTVPGQPVEAKKPEDAAKPADAPKPAEAPKPKKVMPPPEPEPEPSFMDDFGSFVYGGAGVIVLLLAWLGIKMRNKRKQFGESTLAETNSQFGDGDFSTNSVFGRNGGATVDTGTASLATDFSHSAPDAGASSPEGVDPVAEADVYMAYGRDAQAEEILLDALKSEPGRSDVQLKLLEIYAGRKSAKAFESIAKDIQKSSGGSGEAWDKVVTLGQELDPNNPLYGGEGAPAPVAPAVTEDPSFGATTVVLPSGELARMAQMADSPEFAANMQLDPNAPPPLDFDLDEGEQNSGAAAAPALDFELDQGEAEPAKAAMPSIDFDLELPKTDGAEESASDNSIDFNLSTADASAGSDVEAISLDETVTQPGKEEVPAVPALETPAGDFNFSLDTPAPAPAVEAKPAAAELATPPVDLSAISLELDQAEAAESPLADALSTPAAQQAAEENPEVATKLELAQAYEEMGDKEGVRELLQEVLVEGTPTQQEIARQKLAKL